MIRLTSIMIAITLLLGCSSASQNVRQDFVFQNNVDTGLMVIATRLKPNKECVKALDTLALYYKRFNPEQPIESGSILINNMILSTDFQNPDGYFYIKELKPGRYRFTSLTYMGPGYMSAIFGGHEFVIRPHQVNYLGEVTINVDRCGHNFGETHATITFKNMISRDSRMFKERVPGVKPKLVYQKVR